MSSAGLTLDAVTRVELPRRVLDGTKDDLLTFGREGNEGLVLWVGELGPSGAKIRGALVPPQRSIKSEDGVGYFIETNTLFTINKFLSDHKLRLIAQVHSHPTDAYHSKMDDEYAIVTTEGGFSLVVPDFARGPAALANWATYRLTSAEWKAMRPSDVARIFSVTDP